MASGEVPSCILVLKGEGASARLCNMRWPWEWGLVHLRHPGVILEIQANACLDSTSPATGHEIFPLQLYRLTCEDL